MVPDQIGGDVDPRSDEELLRTYLLGGDDNGVAWNAIYWRHRRRVIEALESGGLEPSEAERRVGSVFLRALLDRPPADVLEAGPLLEILLTEATTVAQDPDWSLPG